VRTLRFLLTAALTAALLALPAGALAQSAGDEQYTDPFGESDTPAQGQEQGAEEQAPAQQPAPAGEAAPAAPAQSGQAQAPAQLPHKGSFGIVLSLATGSVMLLAGFAIRRTV